MSDLEPERSIVGVSSEGGLLEYASDQEIRANLRCLHRVPGGFLLVGSLVRDENLPRTINEFGKLPLRLFDMNRFADLSSSAGWHVARRESGNPIYHVVCLRKNDHPPTCCPVPIHIEKHS